MFMGKDPTVELTTCYDSLCNVKKEERTEAKAPVDF